MIFFTIAETLGKLIGLYVIAYLARILPAEKLGLYLSGQVMLGYALELAYFGSQTRHNAHYAVEHAAYLETPQYRARRTATLVACLVAVPFLAVIARASAEHFSVLPLLLVVLVVPFSFDYVAFGAGHTRAVVVARFLSQLVALGWVSVVDTGAVGADLLYWGAFAQSVAINFVILAVVLHRGALRPAHIVAGLARWSRWRELRAAFRDQGITLALRILSLSLISGELLLLGVLDHPLAPGIATELRLAQVFFPFLAFYVESNARQVSAHRLDVFVAVVLALTLALLIGSPAAVAALFGRAYLSDIASLTGLLPALLVSSLVQYLTMCAVKDGQERPLFRAFALTLFVNATALIIVVATDTSRDAVTFIYAGKAVLLACVAPYLTARARGMLAVGTLMLVGLNIALAEVGYFAAAGRLIASVMGW